MSGRSRGKGEGAATGGKGGGGRGVIGKKNTRFRPLGGSSPGMPSCSSVPVEVQLDVKVMMTWLPKMVPPTPDASSIVCNILLLQSSFECCKFVFIIRF